MIRREPRAPRNPRTTRRPISPALRASSSPTLAIASLLAIPPAALGGDGPSILQSLIAHPSFITVLLGVTEGITIWILATTRTLIAPVAILTLVNLLSYRVGLGLLISTHDTALPEMAARVGAAFAATVLLEWPAVRLAVRGTDTQWIGALGLCAVANTITFIGWVIYAPAV